MVSVAGEYRTEYHDQYDFDQEQDVSFEVSTYYPQSIRPAPKIIQIPKTLNHDSRYHLQRAHELFWVDPASCANRLRIVVEYLLDQLAIARNGVKGKRLDLAARIERLKAVKPGHEDALTALRYVGNNGSHDGFVDFEDVVDCFDFLEEAITELLENQRAKRAARMQEIIAAKGKPQP
ncbi:DUF4145 domain-containing protein [Rhizobium laguerreae]|nr:DUF4145 domain-containing protein [Rhizobium laguerreae]MBY3127376.1 DUF4145 domain-containing protein [Rhizobium laguerreae]MBY3250202.1 DUF4145 domain-containing protein [Rhizobium laguerreae]